ncbi:MAG: methylmalonyl-CoA mutase family protein, partial [Stagnimonas sp.]|nr:methylmalonyl-CoA mutase family protein [Stagnimonas sp.]
ETGYQRGKIQEESMHYEHMKHDGSMPIIGVNTFRNPKGEEANAPIELARSTTDEKDSQLVRLKAFHATHASASGPMLERLRDAVVADDNVFAVLIDAVQVCSLGQISQTLFEVGGRYRRNM